MGWKDWLTENTEPVRDEAHDTLLAACALFLEMAHIDDHFDEKQRQSIIAILIDQYGLKPEEAENLSRSAEAERQKSLDLWHFTKRINTHMNRTQKLKIVDMLWKLVYSDGQLDRHEDYLIHKLVDMLHLSHSDLIDSKLRVLNTE